MFKIAVNDKSTALIQESFLQILRRLTILNRISQSHTATTSKEVIRLARKSEGKGTRRSRYRGTDHLVYQSFQETCIQLPEQISRSFHNATPSHFLFSHTSRTYKTQSTKPAAEKEKKRISILQHNPNSWKVSQDWGCQYTQIS